MIVPLTLADFLERAELVYGHREAVVDEPTPPGGGLGRFTYAQFASMARSLAATLDDLGVGGERPRGHRLAERGPLPHQPLRGERVRARAGAGELPAERGGDPLHHRALRLLRAAGGSRAGRVPARHQGEAPLRAGQRDRPAALPAPGRDAAPAGHRRERDGLHQLHLRHHRAAQGRAAHPPQLLAQRGHLRLAPGHDRPRRVPAHAAHLPLQRLGHALRGHRHGRPPRHHPEDRRRGDPAPRGERGGHPLQLRARR